MLFLIIFLRYYKKIKLLYKKKEFKDFYTKIIMYIGINKETMLLFMRRDIRKISESNSLWETFFDWWGIAVHAGSATDVLLLKM